MNICFALESLITWKQSLEHIFENVMPEPSESPEGLIDREDSRPNSESLKLSLEIKLMNVHLKIIA